MPTQILMPALSPTMEEGTLAKWLVKEGDVVKSGDIMAEIETDKATMEFEAVDEGTIGKIMVAEGTEGVKVNTPLAVLLGEGEDASAAATGPAATTTEPTAGPIGRPAGGAPAAPAAPDRAPAQSAGPAADAPAPSGVMSDYSVGPSPDRVANPDLLAMDAAVPPMVPSGGTAPAAATGSANAPRAGANGRVFASPLARRLAAEKGLDLGAIQGSGPHGRIVRADVEAAQPGQAAPAPASTTAPAPQAEAQKPAEAPKAAAVPAGPSAETVLKMYAGREFEEVKLDGMRRTVAARLTEAKQTIPHFYLRRDVTLDALLAFRAELNAKLEKRKVKLSVNDFVIKACALALQEVPAANVVWAGDRMLRLKPSDVAVAVAVEGGLFTPVLRDAEAKSISALSAEMKDLASRARSKKLAPQEYQGGSFAISNLGMFGIDSFDAVINPPHGAILAVGAGVRKPVVGESGQVEVATVMTCTLSVDHRVIDGALGAELLEAIKGHLENPVGMLA